MLLCDIEIDRDREFDDSCPEKRNDSPAARRLTWSSIPLTNFVFAFKTLWISHIYEHITTLYSMACYNGSTGETKMAV